ncbi:hypothetical protein PV325_011344 [Microctonus aethiopoides]|uniref:BTB domain-containing protein n=1 Tax=Microctonus aethiopoides TaxID=144406 RepID=A0AA39C570_9HYME|nr:hypothetical protein PV325_011344 [Microctonus aethiopoides]KAK0157655.1 hypothetical protein PV328_011366 [Microctonus aethiopoides]
MNSADSRIKRIKTGWKIVRFKTLAAYTMNLKLCHVIASSNIFSIRGHNKWYFQLISSPCPIAGNNEMAIEVKLFRVCNHPGKISKNVASIACGFMAQNGKIYSMKCVSHTFRTHTDSISCTDKHRISQLINDLNINNKNEHLRVYCYIQSIGSTPSTPIIVDLTDSDSQTKNLLQHPSNRFVDLTFADVKFIIDDREINAHKDILMARSEVFAAMFSHDMKYLNNNEVIIDDICADTFEIMMRYIYNNYIHISNKDLIKLLYAADKYKIIDLKEKCAEKLWDNVDVENAIYVLMIADCYRLGALLKKTQDFVWDNLAEVKNSRGYCKMNKKSPRVSSLMCDIVIEKSRSADLLYH